VKERSNPGGALTGATGDLTPDTTDDAFVPGERREISEPESRGAVTAEQGARAPAQSGDVGDPAGDQVEGGPTNMAERESGYGSEHGLSPNDPAYRMDTHPVAPPADEATRSGETRIGGDELSETEEHF
jgi:hypothetical protein